MSHGTETSLRRFAYTSLGVAVLAAITYLAYLILHENQIAAHYYQINNGDSEASFVTSKLPYTVLPFTSSGKDEPEAVQKVTRASENHGIRLGVSLPANNLVGKPIILQIALDNRSREEVFLTHLEFASGFYFELIDASQTIIPRTDEGKRIIGNSLDIQTASAVEILPSGCSITGTYDLLKFFDIQKPGPYKLTVLRKIRGTARHPITGDKLDVHVDSIIFNVLKGQL